MEKESLKGYKLFKIIQLAVLIIFAVAFFSYLYFDPKLKNNIFSNKNILAICVFLWTFMIYSAISIFFDFTELEKNIVDVHTLNETAYLDKLTRLPNRNSIDLLIANYRDRDISKTGCALVKILNLSDINKKDGRESGDSLIKKFSAAFEKTGDKYGFVGRNGGNEFIIIIDKCSVERMQSFADELSNEIKNEFNVNDPSEMPIDISFKYALNPEENVSTLSELFSRMYRD